MDKKEACTVFVRLGLTLRNTFKAKITYFFILVLERCWQLGVFVASLFASRISSFLFISIDCNRM